MPAQRLLPSVDELMDELQTLSRQELATKYKVSRSAISLALRRGGEGRAKMRHAELLPWRVSVRHASDYSARMLRLEGRRRAGADIADGDAERLDSWKAGLRRDGDVVVLYIPEHNCEHCDGDGGFHPMRRADAQRKYGPAHDRFDTELIFVTQKQGDEILRKRSMA